MPLSFIYSNSPTATKVCLRFGVERRDEDEVIIDRRLLFEVSHFARTLGNKKPAEDGKIHARFPNYRISAGRQLGLWLKGKELFHTLENIDKLHEEKVSQDREDYIALDIVRFYIFARDMSKGRLEELANQLADSYLRLDAGDHGAMYDKLKRHKYHKEPFGLLVMEMLVRKWAALGDPRVRGHTRPWDEAAAIKRLVELTDAMDKGDSLEPALEMEPCRWHIHRNTPVCTEEGPAEPGAMDS